VSCIFGAKLSVWWSVSIALKIVLYLTVWSQRLRLIFTEYLILIIPWWSTAITVTTPVTTSLRSLNKWLCLPGRLSVVRNLVYFHLISLVNCFPYIRDVLKLFAKLPSCLSWRQISLGHGNRRLLPLIILIVIIVRILYFLYIERVGIELCIWAIILIRLKSKVHYFKFKIKRLIFFPFK
jgi:hypothetical protein